MTNPFQTFAAAAAAADQLVGVFARLWADCFAEASHRADCDTAACHGYISGQEVYADALDAFTAALANMRWHRVARSMRNSANSDAPMAVAS